MQQQPPQTGDVDLREYVGVLRQRKWSIALVAILVVGVAVGLTLRQSPVYTSESRVLVLPTAPANSQFYFLVTINMDTESGLVNSEVVANIVRDNLAIETPVGTLLGSLSTSVESGTEILDIDYTDPDPARAQQLSQAFAGGYLQFRQQQAQEQIKSQAQAYNQQISDISNKIVTTQKQVDAETDPAAKQTLQARVASLQARLGYLQGQLAQVSGGAVQPGGQIVQPATLPSSPSNAGPIRNGLLALFVGLALGVGLAFIRERLDDRLRGREDLEQHLGAPVLVVVPKIANWRDKKKERLVTVNEPKSVAAESYRTLRTSILFMASQQPLGVIMVSSPAVGEGKTTTSANLAVVLAQAGKKVVLVSADLRKPRVHRFFGLENDMGLVDVLSGTRALRDVLQLTDVDGLSLLSCGQIPARPAELLQSEGMGELLASLRQAFDFVVIDSAPALVVADALVLAPVVDGVLFITDAQATSRQSVTRARNQLEQVGAVVIGGVLNDFDASKARGGYYYHYYYRYPYQQPGGGTYPQPTDGKRSAPDQVRRDT